ncbi:mono/diheme cytochrome c family protein [Pseudoxanthomonas winnipegensis]|nr:cytochrome c [Pseudoxanthomonas winnipegensis]MDQ1131429.1 mono/diheme cytochrome c family protein [Pseudoxanthomonas winnipegensis]
MLKRLALGVLGLLVLAVVGLWLLAWRPSIEPIAPPAAASFPAELVQRGQVLAGAGYCATCHTAKGGAPYAGNYPMETAFGTLYSSNITPDPDTGIGRWSQAAFVRAMRQGVARDGAQLFPAFPYQHFELVSDEDLHALYAFLMTRPPVHQEKRENELPFPLNWRALQAGWKLLFFRHGQYGPVTGKDAQWNRGAYLAEGLAHCSACHSPRNALGAEKTGAARYDGARIDGWYAPPLNATNHAPVPWTQDELYTYLRTGATALHGSAAGPMSPVVHHGLSALSDEDVQAIAAYYAERFGTRGQTAAPAAGVLEKGMAGDALSPAHQLDQAANLYNAACASCHYQHRAPSAAGAARAGPQQRAHRRRARHLDPGVAAWHRHAGGAGRRADARFRAQLQRRADRRAGGVAAPHPHRPPAVAGPGAACRRTACQDTARPAGRHHRRPVR